MKSIVRCYEYKEINRDLLKQFSEGSEALENLLNYCYDNKIKTKACCAGHGVFEKAYVLFILSPDQLPLMENALNRLFGTTVFYEATIQRYLRSEKEEYEVVFRFNSIDDDFKEQSFQLLQNSFSIGGDKTEGIFSGFIDFYKNICQNDFLMLKVHSDGIRVYELKNKCGLEVSLKEKNNYYYPEWIECDFIKTDEIQNTISEKLGYVTGSFKR